MIDDLSWILNSPSLVRDKHYPFIIGAEWLNEIADVSDAAVVSAANEHPRLGIYYENLVNAILNKSPQLSDIERNIQVSSNKITIGEFDFIGRHHHNSEQIDFHLECAIKFYLCRGDGSKLSDFVGPNKRDRLDIKLDKMTTQQLLLSKTDIGSQCCLDHGIAPQTLVLLLQGYLFFHYDVWDKPLALHQAINPNHHRGWWLREDEVNQLDENFLFAELIKPYWLSNQLSEYDEKQHFIAKNLPINRPKLISRIDKNTLKEVDRGFVVPRDW